MKIDLMHGDCLELMKQLPDKSIDLVLTDPPYGTTACKWDSVIDFKLMWEQLNRICNPTSAIVLFGAEPFSSMLRASNINHFKYDWIWKKQRGTGHLNAKKQPMRDYEIVSVFYKNQTTYHPQGLKYTGVDNSRPAKDKGRVETYGAEKSFISSGMSGYPTTTLCFDKLHTKDCLHPTQKPVELLEYLIKTYTNENQTVLDFTMGSGSTGVACKNLSRNFIGIEKDDRYFEIAKNRIGVDEEPITSTAKPAVFDIEDYF